MTRDKNTVARYAALLLTICTATQLLNVQDSFADDTRVRKKFRDRILVIQPKPVLQRNRVELVPVFRASINDQIVTSFAVGGALYYHILESLYIGGGFEWSDFGGSFGGLTSTAKDVSRYSGANPNGAKLNYYGFGEIGYVPVMGKLAIFNSAIGYYDLSISVGGGYVGYESILDPTSQGTWGINAGLTFRAFLTDWLALNISVRDLIFLAKFQGQDSKPINNVVSAGLGLSIYIPFGFEYSESSLTDGASLNVTNDSEEED